MALIFRESDEFKARRDRFFKELGPERIAALNVALLSAVIGFLFLIWKF